MPCRLCLTVPASLESHHDLIDCIALVDYTALVALVDYIALVALVPDPV